MNISGLSTSIISSGDTTTAFGVSMLSNSLDALEIAGDGVVDLIEQSVTPHLGANIDISI